MVVGTNEIMVGCLLQAWHIRCSLYVSCLLAVATLLNSDLKGLSQIESEAFPPLHYCSGINISWKMGKQDLIQVIKGQHQQ